MNDEKSTVPPWLLLVVIIPIIVLMSVTFDLGYVLASVIGGVIGGVGAVVINFLWRRIHHLRNK